MHSSTASYIALQNMFKRQYLADLAEYQTVLGQVLAGVGLPADAIPQDEVESFVRNSAGVDIVNGTSLRDQKDVNGLTKDLIRQSTLSLRDSADIALRRPPQRSPV